MTRTRRLCCDRVPQRWVFAVMGSLALASNYAMSLCFALAITAMVVPKHPTPNATRSTENCPAPESIALIPRRTGTYEWDEYTQGIIISSFFWGSIVTCILGGIISKMFGGKHILGMSIFSLAICTILTPKVVSTYGTVGFITLRVISGLSIGAIYPAINELLSKWAPPLERSKISSTVMTGKHIGATVGTALSGVLIQQFSIGWPMPFYVFGALGVLWYCAWVILCHNHPDIHPFISDAEKKYLHETMKKHTHKKSPPTPWRHILTSIPFWALMTGAAGHGFGTYLILYYLPKYLSDVLKFSVQENGLLTAIMNLCMWLVGAVTSWYADWLIKSGKMSLTNVRKMFNAGSKMGPAIFMLAASYAGCNRPAAVIFFALSMGTMALCYSGVLVNSLDLSPNYSPILMSMMLLVMAFTGMLATYTVSTLAPNQGLLEWRNVFWVLFIVSCVTTLIFTIWGDGVVQYWNHLDPQADKQIEHELKEECPFLDDSKKTVSKLLKPVDMTDCG